MTTSTVPGEEEGCPAQRLLKLLAGKWKAEIFRLTTNSPVRFNSLLRQLPGSNKQSLAVALREMEAEGLLEKQVLQQKPLHIEYQLTPKGRLFIPVFQQLEKIA